MAKSDVDELISWECSVIKPLRKRARFLRPLVNKDPRKDICTVVYLFAIIACFEIGWQFFWVFAMNIIAAFVLQQAIEAKRPMDYDPKLRPKTEVRLHSYGFPSIESAMAVVVFGSLSAHYKNAFVTVACVTFTGLVGLSRVYARSRFVHQVVGSYVVGYIGLKAAQHYCAAVHSSMMPKRWSAGHLCCTLALGALLLAYIAIRIENNDTKWAALNRTEYIRVIGDIVHQSSRGAEAGDEPMPKHTPRTEHRIYKHRRPPRDSFFYLQRNLLRQSTTRYDGSSYEESWALDSARDVHFSDREQNPTT